MQSSIETLSGTTASKKELNQFEQRLEGLAAGVLSIFRCASRTSPLTQAMTQAKPPQLAQDVVDVNRNISSLNGKLEKLRSKMAFFAE